MGSCGDSLVWNKFSCRADFSIVPEGVNLRPAKTRAIHTVHTLTLLRDDVSQGPLCLTIVRLNDVMCLLMIRDVTLGILICTGACWYLEQQKCE